jgi:hypothetical protein
MDDSTPVIPLEVIEMIVDIDNKPWRYVNKWYSRMNRVLLQDAIHKYTTYENPRPRDYPTIWRIFINMCKYPVFEQETVVWVMNLLLQKTDDSTLLIIFLAIGYYLADHIIQLISRVSHGYLMSYDISHNYLGYSLYNKTYDLRNDLIVEIAITRPNSVDFLYKYINGFYREEYQRMRGNFKKYQFRDCFNIQTGENMIKLTRKGVCELPDMNTKASNIGHNLSKAICKVTMDETSILQKCVAFLKLHPGGTTKTYLLVYVFEYFVDNVIKYSQRL